MPSDELMERADRLMKYVTAQIGEQHPSVKLREADVLEIRRLRESGVKSRDLAKKYGVCKDTINSIVARKTWSHV